MFEVLVSKKKLIMPQYIDSYYLVDTRKLEIVYDFFSKYFPSGLKDLAIDYPFPEFSDSPEKIFHSVRELLLHLEDNLGYEYTIYFDNTDKSATIKQIILQYTDDGKIIFGVSIIGNDPSSIQQIEIIKEIKNYLNSKDACATVEEIPPINSSEFVEFCDERYRI